MVVDCHLHLLKSTNFDREWLRSHQYEPPRDTPLESILEWLKKVDVRKAVIMGQEMTRIWNSACGEDYVLNAFRTHPEFFIPLASVEPIDRAGQINRAALAYLKKSSREYGFRGVLLTPPYGQYTSNDRRVYPFYDLAQAEGMIVQFHHGTLFGRPPVVGHFKYTDLSCLNDVGIDFPDLRIVVEHLGFPRTETLFALMMNNRNIYTELSGQYRFSTQTAWKVSMAKEYGVVDRLMYASDYWSWDQGTESDPSIQMKRSVEYVKTGLNEICTRSGWATLDRQDIEGILWKNANRLYSLGLE